VRSTGRARLEIHNVLLVATMNDVVYALDADSNATNGVSPPILLSITHKFTEAE
jgi:hypothetical protein